MPEKAGGGHNEGLNDDTAGALYTDAAAAGAAGAAALRLDVWLLKFRGPCRVDVGLESADARLQCDDCDDIVEHAGLGIDEQNSDATGVSTESSFSSSSATLVPVTKKRLWLHERVLTV